MFWDENTRFKPVPHKEESHQVTKDLSTENVLDLGVRL